MKKPVMSNKTPVMITTTGVESPKGDKSTESQGQRRGCWRERDGYIAKHRER